MPLDSPVPDQSVPTLTPWQPWWKRISFPSKRFQVWFLILTVLLFVGTCVNGLIQLGTPQDINDQMTPQEAFEWLGCKPMPASVHDLKLSGGFFGLSDASITIKCGISPADFDLLVKRGCFVPMTGYSSDTEHHKHNFPDSEFYQKRTATFNEENDMSEAISLEVSKEHDWIILFYWHS